MKIIQAQVVVPGLLFQSVASVICCSGEMSDKVEVGTKLLFPLPSPSSIDRCRSVVTGCISKFFHCSIDLLNFEAVATQLFH